VDREQVHAAGGSRTLNERVLSPPPLPVGLPQRRVVRCREWESNPHEAGFKSAASAGWAITARRVLGSSHDRVAAPRPGRHGPSSASGPTPPSPTFAPKKGRLRFPCCEWESNPHVADSRSAASASWATAAFLRLLPFKRNDAARRIRTCNLRDLSPAPLPNWATAAYVPHAHAREAQNRGARGNRTLATTFTVLDASTTTRAPSDQRFPSGVFP
jgi:hypothetical protein